MPVQHDKRTTLVNAASMKFRELVHRIVLRYSPKYFPIAYKLAIILTILITAGMVLLGLVIVTNQTQLLRHQINGFGQATVSQLGESSKELILSDDLLSLMIVTNNLSANDNILGAMVYSDNGKVLASSGIVPGDDIIQLYARSKQVDELSYSVEWVANSQKGKVVDAISFIAPIRFQNVITGHALVTFSKSSLSQAIQQTISAIAGATLFMIFLGIIIAFVMGKKLSRPIHRLMDASKAISNGQYNYHIKERRNDEIGYLTEAFNKMASGLLEKSQVENAFSRFVSTSVAKQIMENLDHIHLGGKHVEGSVLFADIVGFTSYSEKLPPSEVADMLNEYFSYISLASSFYHGTIDKYMGDCAMVIFGIPEANSDHKFHALACAVMIQKLVSRLNAIRIRDGKHAIHFRIGVNSGMMLAGNMGSQERMQYTVVGETVNLASRLHTVAEKDQIIITDMLYHDDDVQWRIQAQRFKSIKLRGISEPVSTYVVTDVNGSYQASMEAQINEIMNGNKKVVA